MRLGLIPSSIVISLCALLLGCNSKGGGGTPFLDRGSCDVLIECASQLQPSVRDEYEAAYGPNGTCWQGGPQQWQACRDSCDLALDGLNQAAMISGGEVCGTCQSDADCSEFGPGASCDAGICVGGSSSGSEVSDESGGDGDGDPACEFPQPEICADFVACMSAIVPSQAEMIEEQYGADGSCWCTDQLIADTCEQSCVEQMALAQTDYPDIVECQGEAPPCMLDPDEPYGPPSNGSCPAWMGMPQTPLVDPLGLSGSYCAPECSGLAMSCPEHIQSSADGTCYIATGDVNLCALRCWVDPNVVGGEQCPCGATCQPHGAPDGEGHMRGLCLFE